MNLPSLGMNLPFLSEIGVPLESYEHHGDVVFVRLNALDQGSFSHLAQSVGRANANEDGWYLSDVDCEVVPHSWTDGYVLIRQQRPKTISVAGQTMVENVKLTFRQIPNVLAESTQRLEDLRNGLY